MAHHSRKSDGIFGFLVDMDLIPEGLDSISILFIFVILISAIIQVLYMISPQTLKKIFEKIDYNEDKHGVILDNAKFNKKFQLSGIFGVVSLLISLLFLSQSHYYTYGE